MKEKHIDMEMHKKLLESKEQRDKNIDKEYILDKVKKISLLPDDVNATIQMVANYFEVGKEAINSTIKDYRSELEFDGLKVLRGQELMSLKDMGLIGKNSSSFTVIPRRAILRIGQLLRDSMVAVEIRNYLLNIEQDTHRSVLFLTESDRTEERDSTRQGNSDMKLILKNKVGATSPKHFSNFFLKGYEGSYNVTSIKQYNALKGLHENAKPLDHMDSLELASYRFRIEMTKERIENGEVNELSVANEIHKSIGKNVAELVESVTGRTLASLPVVSNRKHLVSKVTDYIEGY
ncbi:hypothetical protein [Paenibacillus sp. O199]|uniref:hypothetical protein n=1 Tax=Paenibacillus sp. O199 TaxID=1643925 RepID=UPI0007BFD3E2|nr:hypothetical protein [Paenibacillus sp. O199]